MRLFIAVDLDERVRAAAAAIGGRLRGEIERGGRRLAPAGASWVAPHNMHLTVRFLGEVEEARAALVAKAVGEAFRIPAFAISIGGVGLFPPAGRPRVLWIGVPEGNSQLVAVHGEVEQRLDALGFEREQRAYHPHLTLARFREPASAEVRVLVAQASGTEAGHSAAHDVVLYESRLSSAGPTYHVLARAPLAPDRRETEIV
jgi:2'-5' RNA ligase